MGTRSIICIGTQNGGQIDASFFNYNGYFSGNGRKILAHWNEESDIWRLINFAKYHTSLKTPAEDFDSCGDIHYPPEEIPEPFDGIWEAAAYDPESDFIYFYDEHQKSWRFFQKIWNEGDKDWPFDLKEYPASDYGISLGDLEYSMRCEKDNFKAFKESTDTSTEHFAELEKKYLEDIEILKQRIETLNERHGKLQEGT